MIKQSGVEPIPRADRIPRFLSTPYSTRELIAWAKNNVLGPSRKYKHLTTSLPGLSCLNPIEPKLCLGFVGDLMRVGEAEIDVCDDVREFFSDVDYLVGNLEGVLTDTSRRVRRVFMGQRVSRLIPDLLKKLNDPAQVVLSCANNHAGDFGWDHFNHMHDALSREGFTVLGSMRNPRIDLPGNVNLVSATQWSNQPVSFITLMHEIDNYYDPDASANVLIVHWGYEMQLFPSPHQILIARDLLKKWTVVVGHHSHCPQPIVSYPVGRYHKLVAYSLGDFTYRRDRKNYQYGAILKIEMGPDVYGNWEVGTCQWAYTRISFGEGRGRGKKKKARICMAEALPW